MASRQSANKTRAFPKAVRLLSSPQFRRVFDGKLSVSNDCLILYGRPNESSCSRLGLAVSKKIGNAVKRNAWKRRIREAFRTQFAVLPQGYDFVVLPRRGAKPETARIQNAMLSLTRRLEKRAAKRAVSRQASGGKSVGKGAQQEASQPKRSGTRKHFGRGKGKQDSEQATGTDAAAREKPSGK